MTLDWPAILRNLAVRIVIAIVVAAITMTIAWFSFFLFIASLAGREVQWLAVVFGLLILISPVIGTLVVLPLIRRIGGSATAIMLCTAAGVIATVFLAPAGVAGGNLLLRLLYAFSLAPAGYVFARAGVVLGSYIGTLFRSKNAAELAICAVPLLIGGSWFGLQVARFPRDLQKPLEPVPATRALARMITCDIATIDFAADDRIVWSNPEGLVESFRPDGTPVWSIQTEGRVSAATMGSDGTEYVVAGGRLLAIGPDGNERWAVGLGVVANAIEAGKDTVYVTARAAPPGQTSQLIAVSASEKKWELDLPSDPWGVAMGSDDVAFVPAKKSMIAVASNGTTLWNRVITAPFWGSGAAEHAGRIYVTGRGELHAIDESGREIWRLKAPSSVAPIQPNAPAVGSDGTIYYTVANLLTAVNSEGRERWTWKTDHQLSRPVVGPDQTIYVFGSLDPRATLFAVKEGRKRWEYRSQVSQCIGFTINGPRVSADGKYLAFMDNQALQLMALR
jgi:outer membrane protein assembly factor BamB